MIIELLLIICILFLLIFSFILLVCLINRESILYFLNDKCKIFRKFYHKNYTFFDIIFIILYFLEQIGLICSLYKYPGEFQLIVGLFAAIVLTTIAIQKTLLDSKTKVIKDAKNNLELSYQVLLNEYNHLIEIIE